MGFLNLLKPKYYMPYAGTYTLCGFLSNLEKFKVTPELPDALKYYQNNYKNGKGFLLNPKESFDLNTLSTSLPYKHYDVEKKYKYQNKVLSKEKFDYEYDEEVSLSKIKELIPNAYKRYNSKKEQLNFTTNTNVYVSLIENKLLKINSDGKGYEIIDKEKFDDDQYVTYEVHPKLLYRMLKGPRYAHWNNAEIGSHIKFTRYPEVYERKLYYLTNFLHA